MTNESVSITVQPGADLQATMENASEGAIILLPRGTYHCNLVIDKSVMLQGLGGSDEVVLDGSSRSAPVVTVLQPGLDLSLENLVLIGGNAEAGGGICVLGNSRLAVRDCTFRGNVAAYSGGGIYAAAGELAVSRCQVERNKGTHGGGILIDNLVRATIEDTAIVRNQGKRGGGMRVKEGAQVRCVGCTFADNQIVPGGLGESIYVSGTMTRQPQLEIEQCQFRGGSLRPPLYNAGTYPALVRISKSVLTQSMREGVLFEDLGGNEYVAPEPAVGAEGFLLRPEELLLLLQRFRSPILLGPDNPYREATAEEIKAALVQGLDSLERKGYVTRSPTREIVPLRALNGLLAAYAFPEVSLVFRRADGQGIGAFSAWHMTSQLTAEDRLLPSGEHRLRRVALQNVAEQLLDQFGFVGRLAPPGKTWVVAADVLAELSKTFEHDGPQAAEAYLQAQGWPEADAAGFVHVVSERTSITIVMAIRFGLQDTTLQLEVWDTPAGLWLLRFPRTPEDRVEIAPASANDAKKAVADLATAALAMVP